MADVSEQVAEDDLPFAAEYAKSGRAGCRGCKNNIAKDTLRFAIMVQSPMFDGKVPNWYHQKCFFEKGRIKAVADVKNFDQLRFEDQEMIKKKIVAPGAETVHAGVSAKSVLLKDYKVETAKSARSTCQACKEKIIKAAIRISKKEHDSDSAKRYGPVDRWHHLECFADKRTEFDFLAGGEVLPGFKSMTTDEQKQIKAKLPAIKGEKGTKRGGGSEGLAAKADDEPPEKKKKKGENDPKKNGDEKKLQEQSKLIYGYRDQLKRELTKKEIVELLEHNDLATPSGESALLDCLSDAMAFGGLLPCAECQGHLKLVNGGYACTGNITEWTKCAFFTKTPERKKFHVPSEFKDSLPFLKKYKYVSRERIFPTADVQPTAIKPKNEVQILDGASSSAASKNSKPLAGMQFAIVGKTVIPIEELKRGIEALGGKVKSKVNNNLLAVISNQATLDKCPKNISLAKSFKVHVVTEDFVAEAKNSKVAELIATKNICDWGGDISSKVKLEKSGGKSGGEHYTKDVPKTMKMTIKGGAIVNPASGVSHETHVLVEGKTIYNAVLGMVDVKRGTNSFYQLQILESDAKASYKLFRAWGRIGTSIGGNKLETMSSREDAKSQFEELYMEKTGNGWNLREVATKKPNKFYPIDVDYGQDESVKNLREIETKTSSKLDKAIQDLVCMIFDVNLMKSAMLEFELDMVKMPLGKLSKRQLQQAYAVLNEIQTLMDGGGSEGTFLDASNRFYTLIPHNFGMKKPPLLNNNDLIKSKIEMLDSLLEIQLAYNLIERSESADGNPIDVHYAKLKTEMKVMKKESEEFKILETYAKNTHAATHNQYSLKIRNIFKIKRDGEASRYRPFKKLHNRMLLWHGSRTSNYAGILSQGLRIAPPEAPVTGYMFGKGIYFADMVSKSANYCRTSKEHPIGILLLCEVALGDMYELMSAPDALNMPVGKHSTKGVGATQPDPKKNVVKDNVTIPLGEGTPNAVDRTALLYNEYIVYDIAQVNIKYLLEVDFDYKF